MKGIIRPQRGRPSKVTKNSAPTRRPGRGTHVASPGKTAQYDESAGGGGAMVHDDEMSAAAAAAVAVAAAEMGDAEADGEMEEDVDDPSGLAHTTHTENVDLNTAANILANGGVGPSPSSAAAAAGVIGLQDHQQHGLPPATHQPPAPMGGPQQQQLGGPGDQHHHGHAPAHNMDPSFVKATEEMARESGYGSLNVDSGLAKRLAREPGLRIAQQRRPDQQLNLARRSNVEALYAHIAGELAPSPCKNCHKGHGPWTTCVVVDGQMCGSCANCWFNASGARCSFHETRNPQTMHHPSSLLAAGGAGSPQDHTGSFAMQQPLSLPPGPSHSTLAALNLGGPMTNDPVLRYTIDRAMNDVRTADRKTRQIMMIEIAAKQLALQILEYEESIAAEQQQAGPPGQQGMGGEGPA